MKKITAPRDLHTLPTHFLKTILQKGFLNTAHLNKAKLNISLITARILRALRKPWTSEHGMTPHDARRGEENGDDGILSAIQDNPCPDIMRRGGETANSARGHLRKGDIRRANTLEDRRIPTHSVGRYSPKGLGLWYRDPSNPFIDSSSEWEVRQGETLSQLLNRWGDDSGFTIVYQADTDYVLQANVVIRGTFSEASGQVIESFASAKPPITADFFLGNKVIVVRSASDFDSR
jgi:hypothetical protein